MVDKVPDVAADVATVQEFIYSVTGAGRAIPVGVASAALDRLAAFAAQAETSQRERDAYKHASESDRLYGMQQRAEQAEGERDALLKGTGRGSRDWSTEQGER